MGRSRSRSRSPRRRRDSRSRSRSPPRRRRDRRSRSRSRSRGDSRAQEKRPRSPTGHRETRERLPERNEDARPRGGGRPDQGTDRRRGGGGRGGGEEPFQQEARYEWGKPAEDAEGKDDKPPALVEKPNFGLSGALAKDAKTGNMYKGVPLKWSEPADAIKPQQGWRLYVFKKGEHINTLHLCRQSAYLIGRLDIADLKVEHPSCSKQHAVLQFRAVETRDPTGQTKRVIKPYIMDLESVNRTKLNSEDLPPARYVELRVGDTLQFGLSTREYVVMHESAAAATKANA